GRSHVCRSAYAHHHRADAGSFDRTGRACASEEGVTARQWGAARLPQETSKQAYDAVLRVAASYPDLPVEALFKEDLLRRGVAFSDAALQWSARFKPKP